jgi:hypothetical protein
VRLSGGRPAVRSFTLEVNENELKLIELALLTQKNDVTVGEADNYSTWLELKRLMEANEVEPQA